MEKGLSCFCRLLLWRSAIILLSWFRIGFVVHPLEKRECHYWRANSVAAALKMVESVAFPIVYISLRLLATLPVTSCECERSFSSLRHIKTWSGSTIENSRLKGIALQYIHREINLPLNEIIDRFAEKGGGRIDLK